MRTITIGRKKLFSCGGVTVHLTVDGKKMKKLKIKNGKTVSFELDEGEHKIRICGGLFSSKKFSDELIIPAGPFSYNLRVDFPFAGGANYPRIGAAGEDVFEKSNIGEFLGSSVIKFLLMPEVRGKISSIPGSRLRFIMTGENWEIHILLPNNREILMYKGNYLEVTGSGLGTLAYKIEKTTLSDPEKRNEMQNGVVRGYIAALPDYELLTDFTFKPKY